jgi:hypothetical protein
MKFCRLESILVIVVSVSGCPSCLGDDKADAGRDVVADVARDASVMARNRSRRRRRGAPRVVADSRDSQRPRAMETEVAPEEEIPDEPARFTAGGKF